MLSSRQSSSRPPTTTTTTAEAAAGFATHEYTSLSVPSAVTPATNSNNGPSAPCVDPECGLVGDMSDDKQAGKGVDDRSNILFTSASQANICTCPPGRCSKNGCCDNCPGAKDVCAPSPPSPLNPADVKSETAVDQVVPVGPGHMYLLSNSMCCSGPGGYSNQFTVSRPIANH